MSMLGQTQLRTVHSAHVATVQSCKCRYSNCLPHCWSTLLSLLLQLEQLLPLHQHIFQCCLCLGHLCLECWAHTPTQLLQQLHLHLMMQQGYTQASTNCRIATDPCNSSLAAALAACELRKLRPVPGLSSDWIPFWLRTLTEAGSVQCHQSCWLSTEAAAAPHGP